METLFEAAWLLMEAMGLLVDLVELILRLLARLLPSYDEQDQH